MKETNKPKWYEVDYKQDIEYRGPLSYRHFKAIGWLLVAMQQATMIMSLGMQYDPMLAQQLALPHSIMSFISPLSLAFLMFSNFGLLLMEKNYKQRLILNGTAALGIALAVIFLYTRYIIGTVDVFVQDRDLSYALMDKVFSDNVERGFVAFNIFIDLFLCTLIMFFLNYEPKKYFQGGKIKWFRALVILPILYEIASIVLKLVAAGDYPLPISVFPFLTAKPPMMFIVFFVFCIHLKQREKQFLDAGHTHEEYEEYLATNYNSLDFAKFAAIVCLIGGVVDLAFGIISTFIGTVTVHGAALETMSEAATETAIDKMLNIVVDAGFGGSVSLIGMAPIMLLYSYTRTYEDKTIDTVIPFVAFGLIVVIYLEAGLVFVQQLPMIVGDYLNQLETTANAYLPAGMTVQDLIGAAVEAAIENPAGTTPPAV